MSAENRAPRPRYGLGDNAEVSRCIVSYSLKQTLIPTYHLSHIIYHSQPPPLPSINDGTSWLTAHQPDTNYVGAYHGPNYAVYGQHRYDPYHDNLWYGSEGPPPAAVCFLLICVFTCTPLVDITISELEELGETTRSPRAQHTTKQCTFFLTLLVYMSCLRPV
jgi:hypothetical protein